MPALLVWALLLLLAVPALALAQAEAPPADAPVLTEDPAALDQYGTLPSGEQAIEFEPAAPVDPAPSAAETPPVTPAPVDPVTDPAPVDPVPTEPAGEEPAPTEPVGEEPVGETPVEEPPVGSVIENSPEQEPIDQPVYTPPVVAFPPVDIPVATATPLPTDPIPAQDLVRQAEAQVPTQTAAPTTAAPISRPTAPVVPAATIPSPIFSAPRPTEPAPKPKTPFSTGADLVRSVGLPPPATPKLADERDLPGPGVTDDEALNLYQERLVSPVGPAPGGSQFFEVLAQFAMAGGSGPPTGVALVLLVQLATVMAAFALRAPRSMFQMILGVSDRVCVGYRAVSLRPG